MDTPVTINGEVPNLFSALLTYRPTEGRHSRENFLTELFAYVMAKDSRMATEILERFVGRRFKIKRLKAIHTQVSLRAEDGSNKLPDMLFETIDSGDRPAEIWIENKWHAPADEKQLQNYLKGIHARASKAKKHLVLLTPRSGDAAVEKMSKLTATHVELSHVSWSAIHEVVTRHSGQRAQPLTREFEQFLMAQRLAMAPISLTEAQDHWDAIKSRGGREPSVLRAKLFEMMQRVLYALPPSRILNGVEQIDADHWGRIGIFCPRSKVTVGVMYNPKDHASAFCVDSRPLDVIVRIEANCTLATARPWREKLSAVTKRLESAGVACDQGRWRSAPHTLLLGHHRAGFPFGLPADRQVKRLAELFGSMLAIIESNAAAMQVIERAPAYG
jgi:hypothetical protein